MVLSRHPDLAEVLHDDYTVVLNLVRLKEQQSPYVFEGPSFEIWTRIDGTRDEAQIVDELVEQFGAPREQIASDVRTFLAELLGLGLIEDVAHEGGTEAQLD
ncbi:PqqD family protein [Demequina sp. NBRC 110054]|uniref:PqqD family protein n=1 Tax=Demequina sp. NBRC 110054 TaxID=1570343 RepID=UPI0013566655|nr:PqqD family protein [Demequina sp. NBRC 110054]